MKSTSLKVFTVVGTRPEIIRLSQTLKVFDELFEHTLVHTGQNSNVMLNNVFFQELGLRAPDIQIETDVSGLGPFLSSLMAPIEKEIRKSMPDAFVVLGDTNSALSLVIARRLAIPTFHLEAGNRSFDENVPEEVNRRLIDHTADYNICYSEHARRNLLQEGLAPESILLSGSPILETVDALRPEISRSSVFTKLSLDRGMYILASIHRQENVGDSLRLIEIFRGLDRLGVEYGVPVILSTHPRTASRLSALNREDFPAIRFCEPFGVVDYMALQEQSMLVYSDSGTVAEEAAALKFTAISPRNAIERPEGIDSNLLLLCGTDSDEIIQAAKFVLSAKYQQRKLTLPPEYLITDFSTRVASFIQSSVFSHHERKSIRWRPE